uniref:Uncharacterized protein n=1 Tax=viral metagenome TaxID=1070528 RepID=A0A6M3LRT2_9ZZZZ
MKYTVVITSVIEIDDFETIEKVLDHIKQYGPTVVTDIKDMRVERVGNKKEKEKE